MPHGPWLAQKSPWAGPWPRRFWGQGPGRWAMAHGSWGMSYVLWHVSYVLCPLSCVLCRMSCVLCLKVTAGSAGSQFCVSAVQPVHLSKRVGRVRGGWRVGSLCRFGGSCRKTATLDEWGDPRMLTKPTFMGGCHHADIDPGLMHFAGQGRGWPLGSWPGA